MPVVCAKTVRLGAGGRTGSDRHHLLRVSHSCPSTAGAGIPAAFAQTVLPCAGAGMRMNRHRRQGEERSSPSAGDGAIPALSARTGARCAGELICSDKLRRRKTRSSWLSVAASATPAVFALMGLPSVGERTTSASHHLAASASVLLPNQAPALLTGPRSTAHEYRIFPLLLPLTYGDLCVTAIELRSVGMRLLAEAEGSAEGLRRLSPPPVPPASPGSPGRFTASGRTPPPAVRRRRAAAGRPSASCTPCT